MSKAIIFKHFEELPINAILKTYEYILQTSGNSQPLPYQTLQLLISKIIIKFA